MTQDDPTPAGAGDFARSESELPGLEPPARGESALMLATRRSIASLHALGLVDETHALLLQLLLDLAEVVDAGRRQGKASAAAMAAAQILATWQLLLPEAPKGGEDGDGWDDVVAEFRRSEAAIRNAAGPLTTD